jgi:hypothetical protein
LWLKYLRDKVKNLEFSRQIWYSIRSEVQRRS